jgi:hypothetical protein
MDWIVFFKCVYGQITKNNLSQRMYIIIKKKVTYTELMPYIKYALYESKEK